MGHRVFSNSQRHHRLISQRNEIGELRTDLNRELDKARNNGDWDSLREIKSKLAELDDLKEVVNGALEQGTYAQIWTFSDDAYFKVATDIDNIADNVGERLDNLEDTQSGADSPKSTETTDSSKRRGSIKDGKYWLDLQRNDPCRFEKEINELEGPAQTNAYTSLQNEVQKENRFWTMMTNLQQANHDTLKAFIGNFRV